MAPSQASVRLLPPLLLGRLGSIAGQQHQRRLLLHSISSLQFQYKQQQRRLLGTLSTAARPGASGAPLQQRRPLSHHLHVRAERDTHKHTGRSQHPKPPTRVRVSMKSIQAAADETEGFSLQQQGARALHDAFLRYGHYQADLDPLGLAPITYVCARMYI